MFWATDIPTLNLPQPFAGEYGELAWSIESQDSFQSFTTLLKPVVSRPPLPPPAQISGYHIIRPIGEGGMGVVYLAQKEEPQCRQFALKIVNRRLDSDRVNSHFEAQTLALMNHPSIPQVYEVGVTDDNRPYFVMELVSGPRISKYCDQRQMNVRERAKLMVLVCRAIQHVHEKGFIHRDVKPSNILVVESDLGPLPKVIDFGIAKAIEAHDREPTESALVAHPIGTPSHMSPEQASLADSSIDTRTDVYSLGVLLYELLTGTTPILKTRMRQMNLREMRRAIRNEEPPMPSDRLRDFCEELPKVARNRGADPECLIRAVHGDLDRIVTKAISKDPDERYPTAKRLACEIERYLERRPAKVAAPYNFYGLRRYEQRPKAGLGCDQVAAG